MSDLLYQRDGEKMYRAARAVTEGVLLYGHNHEPFCGMVEGKLLLNPGSVGGHFNKRINAEYGLLTLEHGKASGELLQVPYDFGAFARQMVESSLYRAAPVWCELTVEGMYLGYPCVLDFLRAAEERRTERDLPLEHGFFPNDVWDEVGTMWLREHTGWLERATSHLHA